MCTSREVQIAQFNAKLNCVQCVILVLIKSVVTAVMYTNSALLYTKTVNIALCPVWYGDVFEKRECYCYTITYANQDFT